MKNPESNSEFISPGARARQAAAVLARLRLGPMSTIEGQEQLGIIHVAGRVRDLRKLGLAIETRKVRGTDEHGRFHHMALYVLGEGDAEHG